MIQNVTLDHFQLAVDAGEIIWWSWQADTEGLAGFSKRRLFLDGLTETLFHRLVQESYCHSDDVQQINKAFEDLVSGKEKIFDTEYRLVTTDGCMKWVHDRARLVQSADGNPLKVVGMIQDITRQKLTVEDLRKAKTMAEEADRLKTAFLTNMSHEIRTPMNAILGFSELLTDPEISKDDLFSYTWIIKNRCSHLLQIVNDILDISRIEANQIELKESYISLNQILDELYLTYAQRLIDEKKLSILLQVEKPLADDESILFTDELRLRQVFGNLLDNAVKFTREGSIGFGYKKLDNQFVFHITDTGMGIPVDKHDVIFERFRQMDTSLVRQHGGNGLGLAISKAFVELMGGNIWVESSPGAGSSFCFSLPCKHASVAATKLVAERYKLSGFNWNGKKILMAEDDLFSSRFMVELLKLTGAELVCCSTGAEALDAFVSNDKYDLVLMDIQLPDRNGLDLTREFKKINAAVPVIAQTAYAMAGDNIKCLQAGCDDYVSKPLKISDLLYKINRYLHG